MSEFNDFGGNQQGGQFGDNPGNQGFGGNFGDSPNSDPNANFGGNQQNSGFGGNPDGNFGDNQNNTFNNGVYYNNQSNSGLNISLWKTLSIIQIVLGCCNGLFPLACGIVSLIFMNGASNAMNMGDMATANEKFKTGKIWNIVGWVLLAIGVVISILSVIFGFAEAFFSSFSN